MNDRRSERATAAKGDLGAVGAVLREWFPTDPPASTWLGISSLARPEFLVEIEATAVIGDVSRLKLKSARQIARTERGGR